MPAFSFEKISSSAKHSVVSATPLSSTKRGVIVQLLDKLTEARLRRGARELAKSDVTFTENDITPQRTRGYNA